jgi:DNA/RNA-binding domain of Phe-tRNA-synthetase-like protein
MHFQISNDVRSMFPTMRIGVVLIRGANNVGSLSSVDINGVVQKFIKEFDIESISHNTNVLTWKRTYELMGLKKHRSTVDWLVETVFKSKSIPRINRLVTLYLAAELEFLLPIGGYDIRGVEGDITLRIAAEGEEFLPLGKKSCEHTHLGEIVYADQKKILTRNWNTKDCEQAKITESTRDAALFIEAPTNDIPDSELSKCCLRLSELIRSESNCEARVSHFGFGYEWGGTLF